MEKIQNIVGRYTKSENTDIANDFNKLFNYLDGLIGKVYSKEQLIPFEVTVAERYYQLLKKNNLQNKLTSYLPKTQNWIDVKRYDENLKRSLKNPSLEKELLEENESIFNMGSIVDKVWFLKFKEDYQSKKRFIEEKQKEKEEEEEFEVPESRTISKMLEPFFKKLQEHTDDFEVMAKTFNDDIKEIVTLSNDYVPETNCTQKELETLRSRIVQGYINFFREIQDQCFDHGKDRVYTERMKNKWDFNATFKHYLRKVLDGSISDLEEQVSSVVELAYAYKWLRLGSFINDKKYRNASNWYKTFQEMLTDGEMNIVESILFSTELYYPDLYEWAVNTSKTSKKDEITTPTKTDEEYLADAVEDYHQGKNPIEILDRLPAHLHDTFCDAVK